MKKIIFIFSALLFFILLNACKKDDLHDEITGSKNTHVQVLRFIDTYASIKKSTQAIADIEIDSTIFYIESALNFTKCYKEDSSFTLDTLEYTFQEFELPSVSVPYYNITHHIGSPIYVKGKDIASTYAYYYSLLDSLKNAHSGSEFIVVDLIKGLTSGGTSNWSINCILAVRDEPTEGMPCNDFTSTLRNKLIHFFVKSNRFDGYFSDVGEIFGNVTGNQHITSVPFHPNIWRQDLPDNESPCNLIFTEWDYYLKYQWYNSYCYYHAPTGYRPSTVFIIKSIGTLGTSPAAWHAMTTKYGIWIDNVLVPMPNNPVL